MFIRGHHRKRNQCRSNTGPMSTDGATMGMGLWSADWKEWTPWRVARWQPWSSRPLALDRAVAVDASIAMRMARQQRRWSCNLWYLVWINSKIDKTETWSNEWLPLNELLDRPDILNWAVNALADEWEKRCGYLDASRNALSEFETRQHESCILAKRAILKTCMDCGNTVDFWRAFLLTWDSRLNNPADDVTILTMGMLDSRLPCATKVARRTTLRRRRWRSWRSRRSAWRGFERET